MWKIFTDECYLITAVYSAEIQAFTLMPNHFHMILTAPGFDLGRLMNCFMSDVTRTVNLHSGRSGHLFGGPYYRSLIGSGRYYTHALKYVYRNPVRAGLVTEAENYPYNTLGGIFGMSHLPFPIFLPQWEDHSWLTPVDADNYLLWINRPFPNEILKAIRLGLLRSRFRIPTDRKTRKPIACLDDEI